MKKKIALETIQYTQTKTNASYEKLMLDLMSNLIKETKENNNLFRQHIGKSPNHTASSFYSFQEATNMPSKMSRQNLQEECCSSFGRRKNDNKIQEVYESRSRNNLRPKILKNSQSEIRLPENQTPQEIQSQKVNIVDVLHQLGERLKEGEDINKKLLSRLEKIEIQRECFRSNKVISSHDISEDKVKELNLIEKSIGGRIKTGGQSNSGDISQKSNHYGILTEILPYSDRRQIKVRFRISQICGITQKSQIQDIKNQTIEWLGMVFRATASICWNMLLNNYLSFEEVKILFTQNIIFNFIQYIKEMKNIKKHNFLEELTSIINKKAISVLEYLCRQYPQTKIEAPNLALRSILPKIDNKGRSKYDLVWKSGLLFTYRENGDYTDQIMRMINFMIDKSQEQYDGFFQFMKETFEEIFVPIEKRRKIEEGNIDIEKRVFSQEDIKYRQKVKGYTKYLIGRKISKNTLPYTQEEIEDRIFFVKSNAVLRIITKWVEQLKGYFQNPEKKIKDNINENKDHHGKMLYLSVLLKNGIHNKILEQRNSLFENIQKIKQECQKMEYLLADEKHTSDNSQVHLSDEQISVGMYAVNIKRVISSYICAELNKLIHFLLKIPKEVPEDSLENDSEVFQAQARKQLDSVNLITFKLFDLLRCKIHSNEEEIIWIVNYLIHQSKINKEKFNIVRIKDRLAMGTRDIMINAQINKGLVCQIQLAVTNTSDKKQDLLDNYNHFLYELKRSELGPITETVSIWSNLEQRYSYFDKIMSKKGRNNICVRNNINKKHICGNQYFQTFKRPLLCISCQNFYPIPKTCLLNVVCSKCNSTICGDCFYYSYLDGEERKKFIFDSNRLLKPDVMNKLQEYTDSSKPFPTLGFFIKKDILTKEMSFYLAIEKNKQQNLRDGSEVEILVIQTIIKKRSILNRQVNKKPIYARIEKGQFYIKNYEKSELNNFIIFYFDKKQTKKMMTLKDLQEELGKPENEKAKILNILNEPSYIPQLRILKKQTEKMKALSQIANVLKEDKVIVYVFSNFYLLAQVFVKEELLREDIRKKLNLNELKSFAERQTDIVSMEYKHMSTELEDISSKLKPKQYLTFCKNIKKIFLSNGNIESIKCLDNFRSLQKIIITQNKLKSLRGVENLKNLVSFSFDNNQIESLEPLAKCYSLRYISANINKIKSLKGLENLKTLRSLSIYENEIQSLKQIRNCHEMDSLIVQANPIADLSVVQSFPKLTKLFLGKSKVEKLPNLSMLTALKVLSMEEMNLTEVPTIFSKLSLQQLSLANNKIQKIENLDNQFELKILSIANNKIKEISNIDCLQKLETLKLSKNEIKTIQGIKSLDFLKYIYLKNNPIDDLGQLMNYQFTFEYFLTQQCLSQNALKQLTELQYAKNAISSGQD